MHTHEPSRWDGYYEHCKCGAMAGDRRDPVTGQRYALFAQWRGES